jgi:hypothetical protein
VHVRVALPAQVPVYRNADFDALVDRRLGEVAREANDGGDGAQVILPATIVKAKPVFVDVQGPVVRYFATVTGRTRSVITDADLQQLRERLAGKSDSSVAGLLSGMPTIGHASIKYGPSWLPKAFRTRMPRQSSHISVRLDTA